MRFAPLPFWTGAPDYDPPTERQPPAGSMAARRTTAASGNQSRTFVASFAGGPARLATTFTIGSYNGTRIYFGTEWGGVIRLRVRDHRLSDAGPSTSAAQRRSRCASYLVRSSDSGKASSTDHQHRYHRRLPDRPRSTGTPQQRAVSTADSGCRHRWHRSTK